MARIASNVPLDEGRLSRFWDEGFAVFPHAFSKLAISTARDKIVEADKKELLPYEKLFGEIGAKDFDKHRLMASLPEGCDRIQMEITDLVDRLNMQWEIAKVVVIKSTPGGAEQTPHKDIPDFEIAAARKKKPETIQAGLLIAIMPETKLVVYSHCYSEARATKKLTMNIGAGSCLLFRGDLVHCGAAYSITNFRIHVTLKVQGVGWEDDVTEGAAVATYKCPYCPFISQTKEKVRHHRKRCSQHPNAEKIRARRRACDHEGKTCQLCGKQFKTKSGYYHHTARKHRKTNGELSQATSCQD